MKYDERSRKWSLDIEREELDYPNGTVFNHVSGEWEYGYQGDNEFTGDERDLSEMLWRKLGEMNDLIDAGEVGECDECGRLYDLSSRNGRCGSCGDCALHCSHDRSELER